MKLKLTDEQKDTLSYDDVAYLILKETNKKAKIQDKRRTTWLRYCSLLFMCVILD